MFIRGVKKKHRQFITGKYFFPLEYTNLCPIICKINVNLPNTVLKIHRAQKKYKSNYIWGNCKNAKKHKKL